MNFVVNEPFFKKKSKPIFDTKINNFIQIIFDWWLSQWIDVHDVQMFFGAIMWIFVRATDQGQQIGFYSGTAAVKSVLPALNLEPSDRQAVVLPLHHISFTVFCRNVTHTHTHIRTYHFSSDVKPAVLCSSGDVCSENSESLTVTCRKLVCFDFEEYFWCSHSFHLRKVSLLNMFMNM